LLVLSAVILGEHVATRAIREHERLIGHDLVASVDSILFSASARSRANVEALAGLPCGEVERKLAELETHLRYIRAVALAENGRVYCSSALGSVDVPLSAYLKPGRSAQSIALLAQTPFQPDIPVLALFRPTGSNSGVLYIIEGDYLADVLVHGVRYGAQSAVLAIEGSGALDEQGRFHSGGVIDAVHPTEVTSKAWPFVIRVASSPGLVARKRWGYALVFGAVGLLVDGLIAALYLLAFAPRRLLLGAVRHGLRRGEFHVVYQPVVAVASRHVVGLEALLRWHHAKWGVVSPAVFMDEVESSDMLAKVTRFVLQTALADMNTYPPASPLRIAVNVAPRDLERKGFVDEVIAAVKSLPPHVSLVLELTERFLLSDSARTSAAFAALKAEGVKFAIDDFGTQHSNLDLLRRFPFDYVKIDRQFVSQVDTGGTGLISGIVTLARHYDLQVIAEGVETQSQHDGLLAAGVPYAQGYLYQRPVAASMLATSIRTSTAIAND
jgi:EAL domain-containing protein (putative c-di-GMP-specific phosphodiesterase class I)